MQPYNILIGCDQNYFDKWATPLLLSIAKHNPDISLHCHIVNPTKENKLNNIDITFENIDFKNDTNKISYLQSVRFLVANDKFSNNEKVFTLDADSICTRPFDNLDELFCKQYILKHHKEDRWLAGFVVFNDNGLRQEYANRLREKDIQRWEWGRDQLILASLSKEFNFISLPKSWMSVGKNKTNSVFLTLKGEQKETEKYLKWYNKYVSSNN